RKPKLPVCAASWRPCASNRRGSPEGIPLCGWRTGGAPLSRFDQPFIMSGKCSGTRPPPIASKDNPMSIAKSLRRKNSLQRARNVLTRGERIKTLQNEERWQDGRSPYGLPKVKVVKLGVKKVKKAKKKEKAEGAKGAPAAPAAEKK